MLGTVREGVTHTAVGQLDEIQLLALLWARDMRRDEWVHESLKVWSPPLGKSLANLPFAFIAIIGKLVARRSQSLV